MITVTLYTRPGCHLCDQAKVDLLDIQSKIPHNLVEVDIDSDAALQKKYFLEIPVIECGSYILKAPFGKAELLVTLGAVRDGVEQSARIQNNIAPSMNFADKLSLWIAKHWLFAVNAMFILYLGLPVLAPVLQKMDAKIPSNVIYMAYSPLCHQLGFRSFFLFGEQLYYPREAAGISGVVTYGQATGLDENDLLSARAFVGNDVVGYKIALCQRDVAIYAAIILFGLLFGATGRKIPPLHWALWLLVSIAPIGLDGFSQLFSQLPFPAIENLLQYRESTPFLRTLTGFLFGFGTAWFGLPYVEESMRETLALMNKKYTLFVNSERK